jgi:hypothetical protein
LSLARFFISGEASLSSGKLSQKKMNGQEGGGTANGLSLSVCLD